MRKKKLSKITAIVVAAKRRVLNAETEVQTGVT
jgi:hypothetical protein